MLSFGLFVIFIFLLFVISFLVALIDILVSEFENTTTKLIWVLIVLFAPILGSLLYFTIGMRHKVRNRSYYQRQNVIH